MVKVKSAYEPSGSSGRSLGHLSPTSDALFQRPRDVQNKKFNRLDDKIWFYSAPLGTTTLDNIMKEDVKASRYGVTSHQLLPQSYIYHSAHRP